MADGVPANLRPHRATMILIFGIIGIVMCFPLGIAAWVMGNNDLKAMARGEMDPSGQGTTQAGKVCGIISVALTALGMIFWICIIAFATVAGVSQH
jgi:hypothetical protein